MNITTPDSWIERHWTDAPEPPCPVCERPADRCGCKPCDVCGWRPADCECTKCEGCNRSLHPYYVAAYGGAECYVGLCDICWWEWMSTRQLTYDRNRHMLSKFLRAMSGERPCPLCGVMVHPQIKCGDGRIVDYCSPTNTNNR